MMNLTYFESISYAGVFFLGAILFWTLNVVSVVTAFKNKTALTHCLFAAACAITILMCLQLTHLIQYSMTEQLDVGDTAKCMAALLRIPIVHVVGSAITAFVWMAVNPRTFAKPATLSLAVVILLVLWLTAALKQTVILWSRTLG